VGISGTESANTYDLFTGQSGTGGSDFSSVIVDGTALTDNAGIWTGTGAGGETATFYTTGVMDGDLMLTAESVPEPGTWALLLSGLAALAVLQYRKELKCCVA
jgi:hypothetical protein